jgi:hypothetical protein
MGAALKPRRKAERLVAETFGPYEQVLDAIPAMSPGQALATATGAGGLGVVGAVVVGVAGLAAGAIVDARDESYRPTNQEKEDDLVAASAANMQQVGEYLVVLGTTRLLAWSSHKNVLLCAIPLSAVTAVATEKSKASPTNLILVIEAGKYRIKVDGGRPLVNWFAAALARQTGTMVEERHKERPFWLARAAVVGLLFFFGISMMLIAIPTVSQESPAYAAGTAAIGLVLAALGELSRRRLFG